MIFLSAGNRNSKGEHIPFSDGASAGRFAVFADASGGAWPARLLAPLCQIAVNARFENPDASAKDSNGETVIGSDCRPSDRIGQPLDLLSPTFPGTEAKPREKSTETKIHSFWSSKLTTACGNRSSKKSAFPSPICGRFPAARVAGRVRSSSKPFDQKCFPIFLGRRGSAVDY